MVPVMSKPVMLPQSQTHRPDPHRPALRSDGLVINTLHCSEFSNILKIKIIGSLKGSSNIQTFDTACHQLAEELLFASSQTPDEFP